MGASEGNSSTVPVVPVGDTEKTLLCLNSVVRCWADYCTCWPDVHA